MPSVGSLIPNQANRELKQHQKAVGTATTIRKTMEMKTQETENGIEKKTTIGTTMRVP